MTDNTQMLKDVLSLRDIARQELAIKPQPGNKYDLYPCVFHNEVKGKSLAVYESSFICFGKCGHKGDAIEFIQTLHRMDFKEATDYLRRRYLNGAGIAPRHNARVESAPTPSEPPSADWQQKVNEVVKLGQNTLWSELGTKALAYLMNRGLTPETIRFHSLGYIPGKPDEYHKIEGVRVPCGILIPWYGHGALWGVKVRRAAGSQRYEQIGGGNLKGCLYLGDYIKPGTPVIVDEGEFNALTLWQVARDKVSPVAIGSVGNKNISIRWHGLLAAAPHIFARMDSGSGDDAAATLKAMAAARPLAVPAPFKDPNEFLVGGGAGEVSDWLDLALWEVM